MCPQIVDLPEYYPYRTELAMLEKNLSSITQHIPPGSVIVELGCGSATKTGLILNALLERSAWLEMLCGAAMVVLDRPGARSCHGSLA